jgi:hypothetical protein
LHPTAKSSPILASEFPKLNEFAGPDGMCGFSIVSSNSPVAVANKYTAPVRSCVIICPGALIATMLPSPTADNARPNLSGEAGGQVLFKSGYWKGIEASKALFLPLTKISAKTAPIAKILDCSRRFEQNYRCRMEKSMFSKRANGKSQVKETI